MKTIILNGLAVVIEEEVGLNHALSLYHKGCL